MTDKPKATRVYLNSPALPVEFSGSAAAMMNMARALLDADQSVRLTTFSVSKEKTGEAPK